LTMAASASYRGEVIGSLLRPTEVKQAMQEAADGKLAAADLERVQDRAILEAIALQEACGLDVITDGEYRRAIFWDPVIATLDGLTVEAASPVGFGSPGSQDALRLPTVTGKLRLRDSLLQREMRYLLAHTDRPTKATMPAMAQASALWLPGVSEAAYSTRQAYVADLVEIMRGEIAALAESGMRYIQLDSPRYTYACSDEGRDRLHDLGIDDVGAWLGEMIAFDNRLIEGFDGVTFGLHLCRGNHRSMWSVEGAYDPIAERLFNELHVDRLLLEYDSPRAGTFEPLRYVPSDKVVVLGLVSTKEARVESRDEILPRIEEASRFVPIERLALSPQCGFASTLPGNLLGEAEQRQKLELVASIAHEVWRDGREAAS
jgi:5-methyltetrahydropteroyltriglutamate--homocysteine methyltransferase